MVGMGVLGAGDAAGDRVCVGRRMEGWMEQPCRMPTAMPWAPGDP